MNLAHYIGLLHQSETELASAFREVATAHIDEPDVEHICERLATQCDGHVEQLAPFVAAYGEQTDGEPERLHSEIFQGTRTGPLALLRDLHDLYLMATECDICWTVINQAAQGARDNDLFDVVKACDGETKGQLKWLISRIKQAAPQALVVA